MEGGAKRFARIIGSGLLGIMVCMGLLAGSFQAQAGVPASIVAHDPMSKIDPQVLQDTANGQKASFVILLADQANVTPAYSMKDADARGWYVYNTLRENAARTQAGIKAALDTAHVQYQSFWVANMIVTSGDATLVQQLAARKDVKVIESNRPFKAIDNSVPVPADVPAQPNTAEWGVNNVNAPQVWAQGYTGQNIVIGNADTGMRWTHVALKPKYRGWNGTTADHNYNWHDAIHSGGGACGPNDLAPCDDYGHGTHTTGTTVGDDGAGNQVGVAPGARWIGCRNMDVGVGQPSTYTECFQFFIAPTDLAGNNPNPALRPHVINNSWGCPTSEGCAPNTLQAIVENTQASGIFVEASAGNSGPGCSSVTDPPAIYAATFSTGAIDIGNNLVGFSSRGPVTVDSSNRLKPDISAPGSNVRSSISNSDTGYGNNSGTSMAGPHVVGVVALIWSARPNLVRAITETKQLLQQTANPGVNVTGTCGGTPPSQIPNNLFGWGRVDALAAYNASAGGATATVTPVVPTATRTNTPLPPTTTSTAVATIASTSTPTGTPTPPGAGCAALFGTGSTTCFAPSTFNYSFSFYNESGCQTSATGNATITFEVAQTIGGPFGTFDTQIRQVTFPAGPAYVGFTGTMTETNIPPQYTAYRFTFDASAVRQLASATTTPNNICRSGGGTVTVTATSTPGGPTSTPGTPTATSTACTITFSDVPDTSPFYAFIRCLACRGIVNGYTDGTFRPFNNITRGQLSKILSNAAGYSDSIPPTQQTFSDVPPASTFWLYIERIYIHGAISGYTGDGTTVNPCTGGVELSGQLYFRWCNNATRGQIAKIDAEAAGYSETIPATQQTFQDVPNTNPFWLYIERLALHGVMAGYLGDGVTINPCTGLVEQNGQLYFRWCNNTTRGQTAKVIANSFFPACDTPSRK